MLRTQPVDDRIGLAGVHGCGPVFAVMDVVKDYISKCAAEERNAVLGGNAAKFWRLKRLENQARD